MERKIPENLKHVVLIGMAMHPLREPFTPETYVTAIEKLENSWEKRMIALLDQVNIKASVKTDRFSLPYNKEIIVTMRGSSWLASAYEFKRLARLAVQNLLKADATRVRFYILAEPNTEKGKHILDSMGSVTYHFRYYLKD